MSYEAKIILDSISDKGHRVTTFQVTAPRIILAEANTHRIFSRNSASSRAIPVATRIKSLETDYFEPAAFGKNKAGMQAGEVLDSDTDRIARYLWEHHRRESMATAERMTQVGVHKHWANRLLEAHVWQTMVISSTEWSNFFALRSHPSAADEIRRMSDMMQEALGKSKPVLLTKGRWHLPYVSLPHGFMDSEDMMAAKILEEQEGIPFLQTLRKVSVGRCAAVSYNRQETKDFKKDILRYGGLRSSGHFSPFEHVARPMNYLEYSMFQQKVLQWNEAAEVWMWVGTGIGKGQTPDQFDGDYTHFCGNFNGWVQDRKMIPNENDFSKVV